MRGPAIVMIRGSSSSASIRSSGAVTKPKQISQEEWDKRLNAIKFKKEDVNQLVMNYLIIEGHKDAAEKFQKESGTKPEVELSTISKRMEIRSSIQNGQIEEAIQKVKELHPMILNNESILFHLQQQQLIELIRRGNIEEALIFAQKELAPKCENSKEFMAELEITMALFAFTVFQDNNIVIHTMCPPNVSKLLDPSQRSKTATELNSAILIAMNQQKEPKLPTLLKMLKWSQNVSLEKYKYPKITDFSTAKFESTTSSN